MEHPWDRGIEIPSFKCENLDGAVDRAYPVICFPVLEKIFLKTQESGYYTEKEECDYDNPVV